jgi:hypothetical protein
MVARRQESSCSQQAKRGQAGWKLNLSRAELLLQLSLKVLVSASNHTGKPTRNCCGGLRKRVSTNEQWVANAQARNCVVWWWWRDHVVVVGESERNTLTFGFKRPCTTPLTTTTASSVASTTPSCAVVDSTANSAAATCAAATTLPARALSTSIFLFRIFKITPPPTNTTQTRGQRTLARQRSALITSAVDNMVMSATRRADAVMGARRDTKAHLRPAQMRKEKQLWQRLEVENV